MITIGMDFGTSNSSIARLENGRIRLFDLDPGSINPTLLRSFLYLTRDYQHTVGTQAIQHYLQNETGRPVFWQTQKVGTIENVWGGVPSTGGGPIFEVRDVVVEVDTAAKGRLLQSIKTALRRPGLLIRGRSDSPRVQIFERLYPLEDLIALLMQAMRARCEEALGQAVEGVVIGRPVKFSDDPAADANGEKILRAAALQAGFKEVHFELEPVAAATVYHRQAPARQNALVFDFGGGTLDLTVMEVGGGLPARVLATHGVLLGGDDLDRTLIQPLRKHFGEGANLADGKPLPAHIMQMLETWQTMVDLSRPRYREVLRQALRGSHPEAIRRLETLVRQNLGFQLFQELEQAKIRLSEAENTEINFSLNGTTLHEPISRSQFEHLIREAVARVDVELDEVLRKSGLDAGQLQVVLPTGGTSEIPAFQNLLAQKFGPQALQSGAQQGLSSFTTIVGGLAIKAGELVE